MTIPIVFNRYKNPEYKHYPGYLYIGRPSLYANPYKIPPYARGEAVELFRGRMEYGIVMGKIRRVYFQDLEGKYLECFCKPKPCHGDVLVDICTKSLDDELWQEYLIELQSRKQSIIDNYVKPGSKP